MQLCRLGVRSSLRDTAPVAEQGDPRDPADPRNKHGTREAQRNVRRLLMEWDPIGVAGVAGAQDEYDCMISPLLHLLFDGADQNEILEWIRTERVDHFGLSAASAADVDLAAKLTSWWSTRNSTS
jgi:hypothetical protein